MEIVPPSPRFDLLSALIKELSEVASKKFTGTVSLEGIFSVTSP